MKFLYIFPHPDDESFGPTAGMFLQLEQGHEVHLLTLTKGGATKERLVVHLGPDWDPHGAQLVLVTCVRPCSQDQLGTVWAPLGPPWGPHCAQLVLVKCVNLL